MKLCGALREYAREHMHACACLVCIGVSVPVASESGVSVYVLWVCYSVYAVWN